MRFYLHAYKSGVKRELRKLSRPLAIMALVLTGLEEDEATFELTSAEHSAERYGYSTILLLPYRAIVVRK